jgi:[ribosomal protein S5]-alanine N-acetyltransferase
MPARKAKTKKIVLAGKQVFLRPPVMADLREYTALRNQSREFYRWLVNPFKGKKQFAEYIRPSKNGQHFRFFICRNEDRRIVGSIGIFLIEYGSQYGCCVGYMVGAPYVRRGYATEALQLMLHFAFNTLKLHRVEANIQPGNVPSLALARRVGFQKEGYSPRYLKICGQWRDHERWAILVEDWKPKK